MSRIFNFSAGPAMLPEDVLKKAASELVEFGSSGQSVMEMSHRSKEYEAVFNAAMDSLRDIMNIPKNYHILFLQGGASLQFAMVPLNLMNRSKKADFLLTGQWAKKAYQEGKRFGTARVVADSADKTYSYVPKVSADMLDPDADFVHVCWNNTIYGTRMNDFVDTGKVPLVADVSSFILSEPLDVSKFGLIYAGAQKNMGPAGLTVVIVREDLVGNAAPNTPVMLDYKTHVENNSMYNTPPTYSVYMMGLVLEWIKSKGGLAAMGELNRKKAGLLYDFLDSSALFKATVAGADRSLMNVPFVTGNEELDAKFVSEAKKAGFVNLKGHRSVGGMRASIYNAMPMEGVEELVKFMKEFEAKA